MLYYQGRVMFYMFCTLDEESEKKGIVMIAWNTGEVSLNTFDPRLLSVMKQCKDSNPARTRSIHHCFCDGSIHFILNSFLISADRDLQARVKIHQGKPERVSSKVVGHM
jgi:hypothetical protein